MKAFLAKLKAFVDLLPVPFVRLAVVLVVGYLGIQLFGIFFGEFALIEYGLCFLAGAFLWDGLKAKLAALRAWLGR